MMHKNIKLACGGWSLQVFDIVNLEMTLNERISMLL